MAEEWTQVDPERIIATTRGQQAIDLVSKAFLDPGDVVLAEGPAYAGALTTFVSYQANVVHVPMDDESLDIEALEGLLGRLETHGQSPKIFYMVPNLINPSGVTLSLECRRRLVDIAAEREVLFVEDNPYALLRYDGTIPPTVFSLDPLENVVYLGPFSKTISPGIRTEWVVSPTAVYQKLVLGKQAADLCSSPLNQLFAHEGHVARIPRAAQKTLPGPAQWVAAGSGHGILGRYSADEARGRLLRIGHAAWGYRHGGPAGQGYRGERGIGAWRPKEALMKRVHVCVLYGSRSLERRVSGNRTTGGSGPQGPQSPGLRD